MNYTTMIFSPTGGTEKAVTALTSGWGERVATVDLTNAGLDFSQFSFQPKDTVVIAAPSYGAEFLVLQRSASKRCKETVQKLFWSVSTETAPMRIRWWNWKIWQKPPVSR